MSFLDVLKVLRCRQIFLWKKGHTSLERYKRTHQLSFLFFRSNTQGNLKPVVPISCTELESIYLQEQWILKVRIHCLSTFVPVLSKRYHLRYPDKWSVWEGHFLTKTYRVKTRWLRWNKGRLNSEGRMSLKTSRVSEVYRCQSKRTSVGLGQSSRWLNMFILHVTLNVCLNKWRIRTLSVFSGSKWVE